MLFLMAEPTGLGVPTNFSCCIYGFMNGYRDGSLGPFPSRIFFFCDSSHLYRLRMSMTCWNQLQSDPSVRLDGRVFHASTNFHCPLPTPPSSCGCEVANAFWGQATQQYNIYWMEKYPNWRLRRVFVNQSPYEVRMKLYHLLVRDVDRCRRRPKCRRRREG